MGVLLKSAKYSNLFLRIVSAAIILPVAIALVWLGEWPFTIFIALLSGIMCVEWARLSLASSKWISLILPIAAACAVLILQFGYGAAAVGLVVVSAILICGLARWGAVDDIKLTIFGFLYISAAGMSLAWLRSIPANGLETVSCLVGVVIAMDIGAYAVGCTVGGPKMAPKISPGKTWSGLLGGSICAGGVGVVAAVISGQSTLFTFAVLGVVLGLAAQAGDLIESALKRRYNAKDSGTLIPGHGGVLDRLDGFLTVAPLAVLIVWINGGSPFTWT